MRKGFEGLYGLVRDSLQCEPLSGHIFVFSNRQRNRLTMGLFQEIGERPLGLAGAGERAGQGRAEP
jgi:hypothetical protein